MAQTHFGYQSVDEKEKARRVRGVFDSVASRYDVMNDLMSGGMHRLWKDRFVSRVKPRTGEAILDLAGGTGDVAFRLARRGAAVTVADINPDMLAVGIDRARRRGVEGLAWAEENAEKLRSEADRQRTEILAEANRESEIIRGDGDAIHIEGFNTQDVYNSVSIGRFEFADGPPTTSHELNGWGDNLVHTHLLAHLRDGRPAVLYSNKDYSSEWSFHPDNKRFMSSDNTRFGVNLVLYALTR